MISHGGGGLADQEAISSSFMFFFFWELSVFKFKGGKKSILFDKMLLNKLGLNWAKLRSNWNWALL